MKVRYQVEWCSKMQLDDCGDMQVDLAEYSIRNFPNIGLAKSFANKIKNDCYFRCPRVHKQVFGLEYEYDKDKTWYTTNSFELDFDSGSLGEITTQSIFNL